MRGGWNENDGEREGEKQRRTTDRMREQDVQDVLTEPETRKTQAE